jgi:glutamate-1-semialdehyde 2,1-aminomutase
MAASGMVPAHPEYLQALRRLTERLGILLIFDEVVTLRVATGGAQELVGVTPDLTTMGKIIGGGLPVGAFGGRADVMAVLDQRHKDGLPSSGTFNGNPLTMAAGLASIRALTPTVLHDMAKKGEWIRSQVREVFEAHDVPVQVIGMASLFGIHFTSSPVTDYRSAARADRLLNRELFFRLLNNGVLLSPRGIGALSTPMGAAELQALVDAVEKSLDQPLV